MVGPFSCLPHDNSVDWVRLYVDLLPADQFACAYSSRILRQGHIYVMLGHVCFHSTVAATVLKIKTSDIKIVAPKSNLLFPNSIEIIEVRSKQTALLHSSRPGLYIMAHWVDDHWLRIRDSILLQDDGTRHFFTSFLSRERCLDLIISRWQTEKAREAETVPLIPPTIKPPASSAIDLIDTNLTEVRSLIKP